MITKLEDIEAYPDASNSMTFHPEWDVLKAFKTERKELTIKQNITWLASHQDDFVKDTTQLTIPAQFSIHADELGTKAFKQLAPKSFVPIDPSTIAQLNHMPTILDNNKTISRS